MCNGMEDIGWLTTWTVVTARDDCQSSANGMSRSADTGAAALVGMAVADGMAYHVDPPYRPHKA